MMPPKFKNILISAGTYTLGIFILLYISSVIFFKLGLISFLNKEWEFYLGLLYLSIVFGILMSIISFYIPLKFIASKQSIASSQANTKELEKIESTILEEGSYFKALIFSWLLEGNLDKARHINAGKLSLRGQKNHDYVISIFRGVMKRLGPEDEFIGVCDLEFWQHLEFGPDYYLTENIKAIKYRGVRIKRLIVVNHSLLYGENNRSERQDFFRMVIRLNNWAKEHEQEFKKMQFHFFINDDSRGQNDYPKPFAYLSHCIDADQDGDFMTISPYMNMEREEFSADMQFKTKGSQAGPVSGRTKYEEMYKQKEKVKSIGEMLNLLKDIQSSLVKASS